jgi:murein DD-endopeptidase MepM/ murein hydrolase activator NlpD
MSRPGFDELNGALDALSDAAGEQSDVLTLTESRLLESRLKTLMIPSSRPIDVPVGSGFGFRADPFTGRGALHTGLDFPSPVGTEIHAAAGGVVRTAEMHPEYGLMLEIDHGNGLMTRYGHTSKILVKVGDLVKRGQVVADVGTTGPLHRAAPALRGAGGRHPAGSAALPGRTRRHGPTVQTAAGRATPLGAEHR